MENFRKIIKFGNSSFVLSLPIDWIKKNSLGKGDLVSISENINNELVLSASSKEKSVQRKEIVIDINNKDLSRIKREIVSAYLNSYGVIRIKGKMDTITRSMIVDLKSIDKEDLSKSIIARDEEVNRMVYLIIRTMRFTLNTPSLSHKENRVSMGNILSIWDIA